MMKLGNMTMRTAATLALLAGVIPALTWAQPASPPAPPKTERAPAKPPAAPPTLDELLGLKPATPVAKEGAAVVDTSREELDQRLKEPTIDDQFKAAVELMGRSATRLGPGGDVGLDTQRLQEETLRKLDALLSPMKKRQEQQQQQQHSEDQQSQKNKDKQNQQQQQPSQPQAPKPAGSAKENQAGRGENRAEVDPPARQAVKLRPGLDAAKAAWGALPQRLREMLLQGSDERFSTSYEQLTEDYYKRLAEQKP